MIDENKLKDSLSEVVAREYFDPFYTPMSVASTFLLEILYEALEEDPESSGIAYHQYIKQCNMDFSLASLARLDQFLISLNEQSPSDQIKDFNDPKIDKLFMVLVAYIGEVFTRARGQAALWFARDEIKNIRLIFNKPMPASLWFEETTDELLFINSELIEQYSNFIILFSRDKEPLNLENIYVFLPVCPVLNMLLGKQTYSLYDYVINNLQAFGEDLPKGHDIPSESKVFIDLDLKKKLHDLGMQQRYYLQIRKPTHIEDDKSNPIFKQVSALSDLYKEGKVVWAALVQANQSLYLPKHRNKFTSWGEVIYDPTGRTHIRELLTLAEKLSQLKETIPYIADQIRHARRLSNETEAVSGIDYPKSLSKLPVKVSSIMFWRKHLPNGLLSQGFFPILISEKYEGAVTVLPSRLWPEEYVEAWLSAARQEFDGHDFNIMPNILEKEEKLLPIWTLSTSVLPEEFTKECLFPKLTDLFPDHIYPDQVITIQQDKDEQPLFDPVTLKWWEMQAAADNATTEEEKQRLEREAKKFHSENFMTFAVHRDGSTKVTMPKTQGSHTSDILQIGDFQDEKLKVEQEMEEFRRKNRSFIAPEYKILICAFIALIIIKMCHS